MNIQSAVIRFELPEDAVLSRVSKAITSGKIFLAQTPGTTYMLTSLIGLLKDGKRGMVIAAETTFGKTKCLHYILEALSDAIGDFIPYLIVENIPSGGSGDGALLLSIGTELGLGLTSYTPIVDRVNAIVLAFYQWALRSGYKTVVLALDEAQSINVSQLQCLKSIGNKLRKLNCDLFLIMAGQASLFDLEDTLSKRAPDDVDQLAERFLYNYRLPGFASQGQLREFLDLFDLAEFPRGHSVVARYLPRAVQGGFKVGKWDERMWHEISLATPESLRHKTEIGVGHTVEMLSSLLMASAASDSTTFEFPTDPDTFKSALSATRYSKSVIKRLQPKMGRAGDGRI